MFRAPRWEGWDPPAALLRNGLRRERRGDPGAGMVRPPAGPRPRGARAAAWAEEPLGRG
jgi:hypothetical protein